MPARADRVSSAARISVHLILSQRVQQRAGRFEGVDHTIVIPAIEGLGQTWRVAFWVIVVCYIPYFPLVAI